MSYCRWSSDDWRSDLYVYEHCGGWWQIHIAGNRLDPMPPRVERGLLTTDPKEWMRQYREQGEAVSVGGRTKIDHPLAGESFQCVTPGECADRIEDLIAAGFCVPNGVVEELREEDAALRAPGGES